MKKRNQFLDIARLITNELNKSITEEELRELHLWLNESTENKAIYDEIKKKGWYNSNLSAIKKYNTEEGWNEINPRIQSVSKIKKIQLNIYKYAALVILFLGIGYLYQSDYFTQKPKVSIPANSITLQLENGNVQIINEDGTSQIVDDKGTVIGKQNGNKLTYNNEVDKGVLVYNTLTIPYGKRFEVTLSDGTTVNLNAGTSLKYPVKFIKGKNRQVFLNGEAYFNVFKDATHPFVVSANKINVRVLGTQFNVSSYPEDKNINTVLVEGSVSIYDKEASYSPKSATILKPGYKGTWDKTENNISVEKTDTNLYTAWMKGKIILREVAFKDILKKLERQYNVTFVNNYKELENRYFTANFDTESINQVMESFSNSATFNYTINKNQITINP